MDTLPDIPKALLDALQKLYPEKSADPSWSDREIWIRSGQRQVVRFLQHKFDEQTKNQNVLRDSHVLNTQNTET